MKPSRTAFAGLIAAAIIAAVTGCSTGIPASDFITAPTAASPTPSTSAEPAAETTENIVASVPIGGTLTDAQRRVLGKDFKQPYRAYQLSDGSYTLMSSDAPLPENIKSDIGAEIATATATEGNPGIKRVFETAGGETTKSLLLVAQSNSASGIPGGGNTLQWGVIDGRSTIDLHPNKESAIAAAQATLNPDQELITAG